MIVQKIPPNSKTSRMGVNEKGEIVIKNYEGKTETVPELDSAIRQQALHIPMSYLDTLVIFENSFSIEHPGKVSIMTNIIKGVTDLTSILGNIEGLKQLKSNIKTLERDFIKIRTILPEEIQKDFDIVFWVQKRALELMEEEERCEKIINYSFEVFAQTYKCLLESSQNLVEWPKIFKALSALNTVKANPFKKRVQDRTIKILSGRGKDKRRLYELVKKGDVKLAKHRVWQAFLMLLPIYSSIFMIELNGTKFIIEKGSIKIAQNSR